MQTFPRRARAERTRLPNFISSESLEPRRLFAAAGVNQELHRPPTAMADFDGDKKLDLVVAQIPDGGGIQLSVLFDDGSGNYLIRTQRPPDNPASRVIGVDVAAGDVDGDGRADLAAVTFEVDATGPTVRLVSNLLVLHGDGKGGFDGQRTIAQPHVLDGSPAGISGFDKLHRLQRGRNVAVGDVNGDGLADIVTSVGDSIAISISEFARGPRQTVSLDGTFSHATDAQKSAAADFVGIGDLNGDGRPDLVAIIDDGMQFASVDFSSGNAPQLRDIIKISAITMRGIVNVAVGDLDGDGFADDFATFDGKSFSAGIGSAGKFVVQPKAAVVKSRIDLLIADLDGDGVGDVLAVTSTHHPIGTVTIVK